jgi:hypothetical protein
MIHTLKKGNTTIKYLVSADTAQKTKIVGGNTSTTIEEMSPLEANREMGDLIRNGWTKVVPPPK